VKANDQELISRRYSSCSYNLIPVVIFVGATSSET